MDRFIFIKTWKNGSEKVKDNESLCKCKTVERLWTFRIMSLYFYTDIYMFVCLDWRVSRMVNYVKSLWILLKNEKGDLNGNRHLKIFVKSLYCKSCRQLKRLIYHVSMVCPQEEGL